MDQRKKAASSGTASCGGLFIAARMDGPINIRLTLSGNVNHQGHGSDTRVIQLQYVRVNSTVPLIYAGLGRSKDEC